MATIITAENPYQLAVGSAVKLKNQPNSPVLTIGTIQRGRANEHSNAVVTVCAVQWFDAEGQLRGFQCELEALEPAKN